MNLNYKRPFILVLFLSLVLLIPFGTAAAQDVVDFTPAEQEELDCRECHMELFLIWEESLHGQGLSCGQCHLASQDNHAREGHWAQGGPQQCMACHTTGYNPDDDTWEEDNIHCKACHSPIEQDHPDKPMPTNRSETLCGSCHIQAHFEWQVSVHHEYGVTCIDCHNQHSTALRTGNVIYQCARCHDSRVDSFCNSAHNEAGVTCADCHVAPLDGDIGSGSAKLNHSFSVELKTCTACHLEQLHSGPEEEFISYTPEDTELDAMSTSVNANVVAEPDKANPIGFIALLGLVSIGITVVRRPNLLERFRRK
jgi:hypothetical protein